jgi:hypothetical protein
MLQLSVVGFLTFSKAHFPNCQSNNEIYKLVIWESV